MIYLLNKCMFYIFCFTCNAKLKKIITFSNFVVSWLVKVFVLYYNMLQCHYVSYKIYTYVRYYVCTQVIMCHIQCTYITTIILGYTQTFRYISDRPTIYIRHSIVHINILVLNVTHFCSQDIKFIV